jgi:hypothetical protein
MVLPTDPLDPDHAIGGNALYFRTIELKFKPMNVVDAAGRGL